MTGNTTLDVWTEIYHGLFRSELDAPNVHALHACVIDGKPHYVHAPSLSTQNPEYFLKLTAFAQRHGIQLKPDQRSSSEVKTDCRRKKLLPIIFFAIGLGAPGAFAEELDVSLKLVSTDYNDQTQIHEETAMGKLAKLWEQPVDAARATQLEQILKAHLREREALPSLHEEIKNLANYYARYPAAAELIQSIANQEWTLNYAPHTFQTNVKGSRMEIKSVEVYFDPRSGAKLKFYDKCDEQKPFCVASPADALLHELLHVQTITRDKSTFIGQGGLNPHAYPAEHERMTIMKENSLYRAMSALDNQPRPLRNEHSGRHVLVSCVTCLE